MSAAESVLIDAHISDAADGIKLVNSSLVLRNFTMIGSGGIQLTGSTPTSLTLDHASFSTRSGHTVDANLLDASLDLSVIDSRLSAQDTVMKLRCRGRLNIRITNSTMKSITGVEAVNVGGRATQATVAVENSSFIGLLLMNSFTYDLRLLVWFFQYFLLLNVLKFYQKDFCYFCQLQKCVYV